MQRSGDAYDNADDPITQSPGFVAHSRRRDRESPRVSRKVGAHVGESRVPVTQQRTDPMSISDPPGRDICYQKPSVESILAFCYVTSKPYVQC